MTFVLAHWPLVAISLLWAVQCAKFTLQENWGQALLAAGILVSNVGIMVTAHAFRSSHG